MLVKIDQSFWSLSQTLTHTKENIFRNFQVKRIWLALIALPINRKNCKSLLQTLMTEDTVTDLQVVRL